MQRKSLKQALEERGYLEKWGATTPPPLPKPKREVLDFKSLLIKYQERGNSLPALAQLSEVSVSYLRAIISEKRPASKSAQVRIMSSIFELDLSLANVEVEEPPKPQTRTMTRQELKQCYRERRKEKQC